MDQNSHVRPTSSFIILLLICDLTVHKWNQANNSDNYNHEEGEVNMTLFCTKDLLYHAFTCIVFIRRH